MTSTLNLVGNNFSASLHSISDRVQVNWKNHKVQILAGMGIAATGVALTIGTVGALAIAGSTLLITGTAFAAYKTLSASSNVQILPFTSPDEHVEHIDIDILPFAVDDVFSETEVVQPAASGSRMQTAAKYAIAAAISLGLLYAYAKQDKISQSAVGQWLSQKGDAPAQQIDQNVITHPPTTASEVANTINYTENTFTFTPIPVSEAANTVNYIENAFTLTPTPAIKIASTVNYIENAFTLTPITISDPSDIVNNTNVFDFDWRTVMDNKFAPVLVSISSLAILLGVIGCHYKFAKGHPAPITPA